MVVFEGVLDPEIVEAMACREGLALASDMGDSEVTSGIGQRQCDRKLARGKHGATYPMRT